MKLLRPLFTCAVLLLLCGTAAMAQSVQADWDRTFNISKLRTFSFIQQERGPRDPLAGSPINDRRIHDALNAQLQSKWF